MINGIRWIDDLEMEEIIDSKSRAALGISGEELKRRYKAGLYKDEQEYPGLVELVMLVSPL